MSRIIKAAGLSAVFALVSGCSPALEELESDKKAQHTTYKPFANLLADVDAAASGSAQLMEVSGYFMARSLKHDGALIVTGDAYGNPLTVSSDVFIGRRLLPKSILRSGGKVEVTETGPKVLIRAKGDVVIGDLGRESVVMTPAAVTVTGRMGENAKILSLSNNVTVTGCYEANPPAGARLCEPKKSFSPL